MELKIKETPIQTITWPNLTNQIDMKREDMIPFSFGGNKVRIGYEYWMDARAQGCDTMIAYGSSRSNMCRVIATLCKCSDMSCYVVSPMEEQEGYAASGNSRILESMNIPVIICQREQVAETLSKLMQGLRQEGKNPYYILGDAHGRGHEAVGNRAYEKVFQEILKQEEVQGYAYQYIFLASGTGTTQSGLISGQAEFGRDREHRIIGISIARDAEHGVAAIQEKLPEQLWNRIQFVDGYRGGGYGERQEEMTELIQQMMERNGIPLDATYTGKAFRGMLLWLEAHQISGARVLFLHTGGTPLYFDELYVNTSLDR
ncbi:MAG: pyridoxal-phosphate dependent enzyme [Hungatella sp.]